MAEAARAGSDAVLFPECALTGYNVDFHRLTRREIDTGLKTVARAARPHRCYALVGSPTFSRGRRFNSLLVFDRLGRERFRYHKIHLTPREAEFFTPGNSVAFFRIAGVACAAILCHERRLRLYGRYQDGGEAQVSLRASVNGVELKKTAKLEFPKLDPANPEIDRMWAWHRIDNLLKQADRMGSRNHVISEVVKLGEGYSIVTEYTSFLVLENDAEFQRWKIARNNAVRTDRDRKAQEVARAQLETIRNKAVAGLGPQPEVQLASLQPMAPSRAVAPPAARSE